MKDEDEHSGVVRANDKCHLLSRANIPNVGLCSRSDRKTSNEPNLLLCTGLLAKAQKCNGAMVQAGIVLALIGKE